MAFWKKSVAPAVDGGVNFDKVPHPALICSPGTEILRWLAQADAAIPRSGRRDDSSDNCCRYLVLDVEHIFQCSIVALSPDMVAGLRID